MGYKVKSNIELAEKELKEKLETLGIEINLEPPKEDEKQGNKK